MHAQECVQFSHFYNANNNDEKHLSEGTCTMLNIHELFQICQKDSGNGSKIYVSFMGICLENYRAVQIQTALLFPSTCPTAVPL